MKWIGLTGGIGSGKTTASGVLESIGVPVVSADQLARETLSLGTPTYEKVLQAFGRDILMPDGEINRRALGRSVFGDKEQLSKLEFLLHPVIRQRADEKRKELEKSGKELAIYDVPLLFEKNMEALFHGVLLIASSIESQRYRIRRRDSLSEEEIDERIASQVSMEKKRKRAQWIIENEGSLDDLHRNILNWYTLVTSG